MNEFKLRSCIDKTSSPHGCWLWTAGRSSSGYGQVIYEGKNWSVHRLVWVLLRGPIPKRKGKRKLLVCHNCPGGDNPLCCNPDHLWLGNHKQRGKGASGDRNGSRTHPERLVRGEYNNKAKLTVQDVKNIRKQCTTGIPVSALAMVYGVSNNQIYMIRSRKSWRHVK